MKTLIAIVGPTASGKTALSIELARKFNCEIISADSRQFFKEMSIGTAKPNTAEMQGIPHHFIDFISIKENYNAGKFGEDVLKFLEKYFQKKNIAILVGGSGLYVQAVCDGMDKVPPSDEKIRAELNAQLKEKGLEFLLEKLKIIDKKYYDEADKKNPHRIIRALEVCIISGVPYSSFRKSTKDDSSATLTHQKRTKERNFKVIKIGIEFPREKLYDRINQRVDKMFEHGLIEEAKNLHRFKSLNALQTVGYEELFEYFEDKISLEDAVEKIKQNTRRFAKRQMTWFKKDKEIFWFSPEEKEKIFSFVSTQVEN